MPHCDYCGKVTTMPFHCQYCGGNFCDEHRLPPNHDCAGIGQWKKKPTPGVGIRYGRGGGAVPTSGGYVSDRAGRKPKKVWGDGIPYLKIAVAIIMIILLVLLYLGLSGYSPFAEKPIMKAGAIPETSGIPPTLAATAAIDPTAAIMVTRNVACTTATQETISPTVIPATTKIPLTPTATPIALPTKKPVTTSTPPLALPVGPAPGNPYTISTSALEQRVHELVNEQRIDHGLTALDTDASLADIARKHSADMAENNYFAHKSLNGQTPTDRGNASGYTCRKDYGSYYTYGIAENLFQNNLYTAVTNTNGMFTYDWTAPEDIAQSTVTGWMDSPGHRENILTSTYDREGVGVVIAQDDKVYITEDFC